MCFMLQPLSTNSHASQSSNSGCDGAAPLRPKSNTVFTSGRLVEGDDRIDIRVRGDREVLDGVEAVEALIVNPTAEQPVPLAAVARVDIVRGPAEIRRIATSRAALVTAASTGLDLGGLNDRIETALADLTVPDNVVVELGGQKREMEAGTRSLQQALLLAIFLVYVVMATQFESLVQPFVILFSVPLAAVGVVLALDWLSIPVSVVVFIGAILLAGIVVNNAIVLVDRINQERERGADLATAAREAGRARLRPILMTTATTVLGLLPLTGWLEAVPLLGQFGAGEGSELRAPMAVAVVAGLTMSTLLTLLVVIGVSLLITRIATLALAATGLSTESAKFQARSAFSGAGFTTHEAENVVGHPVRRRISPS